MRQKLKNLGNFKNELKEEKNSLWWEIIDVNKNFNKIIIFSNLYLRHGSGGMKSI